MRFWSFFLGGLLSCLFAGPVAASTVGSACSIAGAVERDGGQVLICDGSTWKGVTSYSTTGSIKLLKDYGLLLLHNGNETDPAPDGFRLHMESSFGGTNRDYYVFEKTDGNDPYPDGGIAFVNTGMDGAPIPSLVIRGNGFIGVGSKTPYSPFYVPPDKYAQFAKESSGPPPADDCNSDSLRGRLSIDVTNNRLYICNGSVRRWDYIALTD